MDEERQRVLEMLAEGKLTPDQAGQLLDALAGSREAAAPRREPVRAGAERSGGRAFTDRPDVHELMEARMHGVDPRFVGEMRRAGYQDLTLKDLIRFKMFGVNADYVRELADLGITDLAPKEICELAMHGVRPDFIREMRELGYGDVSVHDLAQLSAHGVDASFLDEFRREGFTAHEEDEDEDEEER